MPSFKLCVEFDTYLIYIVKIITAMYDKRLYKRWKKTQFICFYTITYIIYIMYMN